jgi:hypothetical protein
VIRAVNNRTGIPRSVPVGKSTTRCGLLTDNQSMAGGCLSFPLSFSQYSNVGQAGHRVLLQMAKTNKSEQKNLGIGAHGFTAVVLYG